MTPGNGKARPEPAADEAPPPAALFARETIEKGEIEGLGRVTIREAQLADVWAFLDLAGQEEGRREFGLRLAAASVLIDGKPLTFDDILRLPFRRMKALQGLLPDIMKVNAVIAEGAEEGAPKNAAGVGAGAA